MFVWQNDLNIRMIKRLINFPEDYPKHRISSILECSRGRVSSKIVCSPGRKNFYRANIRPHTHSLLNKVS